MNTPHTSRAGLAIFGLLSLGDVATPLITDGEHPPMAIALVAALIGLISLVLIAIVSRGSRKGVAPLVALRLLSAATALPAFFVSDVPVAAKTLAAVVVGLTSVGVALVLPTSRRTVQGRTVQAGGQR